MNKKVLTDEERRHRRNEASRRCYLKKKAALAGEKPAKAKAKAVRAKPAETAAAALTSAQKLAEKLVKKYARIAAGVKPMVKDAAALLAAVYKTGDQRAVEKIERILAKNLNIAVADANEPKSRVGFEISPRIVKSPGFRTARRVRPAEPAPEDEEDAEQPVEVPVDPDLLARVDAGEADKSEIDAAVDAPERGEDENEDEDEDEDEKAGDEDENEDGDEDEDEDEDENEDEDEETSCRSGRTGCEDDYAHGRWEMLGEMGAQGAFDD